jgi:hypothetical protein
VGKERALEWINAVVKLDTLERLVSNLVVLERIHRIQQYAMEEEHVLVQINVIAKRDMQDHRVKQLQITSPVMESSLHHQRSAQVVVNAFQTMFANVMVLQLARIANSYNVMGSMSLELTLVPQRLVHLVQFGCVLRSCVSHGCFN